MIHASNHSLEGMRALGPSDIRPIHPFPARMAPSFAFDELPTSSTPLRVLDPMVGSGTTTVVARAKGHVAFGFDTDPLAVILSKAWVGDSDEIRIAAVAERVLENAGKRVGRFRNGYPRYADDLTREFIDYWFDEENQRQLRALSETIAEIRNPGTRAVLWAGFSRLIIAKSRGVSLAMDISHSRPHKVYETAPIAPFDEFIQAVNRVSKHMPFTASSTAAPHAKIMRHDARRLPLADSSIDFVITSPPYLNAIDYIRCSKFSLIWMGYCVSELQDLRGRNIGSERSTGRATILPEPLEKLLLALGMSGLSARDMGMLRRYVGDLDKIVGEISRVLTPEGRAIFVVGNSTVHGAFIKNSDIIASLAARHSLKLMQRLSRDLPPSRRYLPPPAERSDAAQLDARMRQEIVLKFTSQKL